MTRDEYVRKAAERLRGIPATAGGHGHVRPRLDGIKARCGGPGLCAECAREAADQKRSDENRAVEIANDMYRRFAGLTGFRETAKAAYNAGREDAARDIEAWSRGETQAWPPPSSLNECVEQAIVAARGQQPREDAR